MKTKALKRLDVMKKLSFLNLCLSQLYAVLILFFSAIVLRVFYRNLLNEHLWLICEKETEARDNGYHFYKYIKENYPEINSYYVITKDSVDYHKVKDLGNIVIYNSFKHVLLYLAAEKNISSQQHGAYPFGLVRRARKFAKKLCNPIQKVVFLQHGIIKDELPHLELDYDKAGMDYFVCSARREYEYVKNTYGYPEYAIGNIGLCRFDKLHDMDQIKEKMVLVMPTWRMWLARGKSGVRLTEEEKYIFSSSEYYTHFKALLTDSDLIRCLREHGYKLYFYMHYKFQDFSELFDDLENDVVIVADRYHYDVQDLLKRAAIMVTDYSSVQFDFAYMNKPLIYFQFDQKQYSSKHYGKGYFSYEVDGFGPCLENVDEVSDYVQRLVCNDGMQPVLYQKRVFDFFDVRDNKNCERTYQAIINL